MKIRSVTSRVERFPLTRPYTIAFRTIDAVENVIVEVGCERGVVGRGAASPEPFVTGETDQACQAALAAGNLEWLVGEDVRELPRLLRGLEQRLPDTPAARAAVDLALHDAFGQWAGLPLVELLGRAHESLPTSITVGIQDTEAALATVREYLGRGFRVLKVKLGRDLDQDLERLRRIRQEAGPEVPIRVDPNQGYSVEQLLEFVDRTGDLGLEFLEQPLPADALDELESLPPDIRQQVAADESLLSPAHALRLAAPPRSCGIFNIKLMKCGGLEPARRIADIAAAGGVDLMWGCMDESRISIAGALHLALASPATRYLDLDGSLDLARDVVDGGFVLEGGVMRTAAGAGLGLTPLG